MASHQLDVLRVPGSISGLANLSLFSFTSFYKNKKEKSKPTTSSVVHCDETLHVHTLHCATFREHCLLSSQTTKKVMGLWTGLTR